MDSTSIEAIVRNLVHESVKEEVKNILDSQKEILTLPEAAELLGMSKSYLYKLTQARIVPHYKPLGKILYFERSVLLDWMRSYNGKSKESIAAAANNYIDRKPLNFA